MKLVYFDTEFTGLHKNTTLISIGLVFENRMFYAEFTDYDRSQLDTWLQQNIISKLSLSADQQIDTFDTTLVYGDRNIIREKLLSWLNSINPADYIQFVSDVSHYDFVLLIDLLYGNAINIPNNISKCCLDLNGLIADRLGISDALAFEYSREKLLYELNCKNVTYVDKHNALYDAIVIRVLWDKLNSMDTSITLTIQ